MISRVASKVIQILPRRQVSQWVGRLCDMPLPPAVSRAVVGGYSRVYRVDMSQVQSRATPYGSFDEFFTRPLTDNARPVASNDNELVSPADGMLQSTGPIESDGAIIVKKQHYNAARLLNDSELAAQLHGGQFAVVYLSPRDYHRVHAPTSGRITEIRGIGGELFPVNSLGQKCTPTLLQDNKRVVVRIDTDTFGPVVVVMVGALIVGRITVPMLPTERDVSEATYLLDPAWMVEKGQQIGTFHLGSTAVVLVGKHANGARATASHPIGPIRVGQPLMRLG